ncbi:MAG: BACON domain-containing protein [Alistipes sp.]|nr:BACON domain-containing protein [Alistipes sp.]
MKNIFRSAFSALALIAGFAVSCTNTDEDTSYQGIPTIEVAPASVTVALAGGTTEAVAVSTPAEWTLDIDTEGVVASTTAGNGDAVVTFEVPAAESMRTIKVTFTATGYVSGYPITKKASLAIVQSDSDIPTVGGEFVYYDNCGSSVSKVDGYWPYVDAYTGWAPTGGEGFDQSGVTYTGKNASVRNSGKTWAPTGATYATDAPYAYLQAKTDTQFVINNIAIKSGVKNYTFSFTAFNQYASLKSSPYTPVVAALESGKNLTVAVSVDGANWGNVAFTTMADGNWTYAIAPFTLPADADKLYVRFSDYKADTTTPLPSADYQYQAALRFDDFRLVEGGNGPVVDFNNAGGGSTEVVEGTIEAILAGGEGNYSLQNAWVVATYGRGCLVTDATGKYILCYMGTDKTIPAVGTVVTVEGAVTSYAGLLQFGADAVVTATTETKSVELGTPVALTGADLDAYVSAPAVKYASFEGALAISGSYYNVTIEGASTAVGSLSYPAGDIATQLSALNGKGIKVTGFMIGVSSGKYTNMMVTAVSATGDDPEAPESITATKIDKVASLAAGNYIMAGYLESYDTYSWAANPYHCWTGKSATSSGKTDLETVTYSYTDGVLAPGSGVLTAPAVVTLEAVDGKTNTYYIKCGDNYLSNAAASNRQLALGATKAEWEAADHAKGGIQFTSNGASFGTGGATKNHIRSYTDASSLVYGVVFFTTDGTSVPTPDPDPTPEPDPTPTPEPGTITTVAEFLAAAVDSTVEYTLKGTITRVANTTYGNFDLTDETGTVYIYGLVSPDGATNKYWATSGAKLGDDITIKTVRAEYNGSAQGSNAKFVEVTSPGTLAFWSFSKDALVFGSAAAEQVITVTAYNLKEAVSVASDNAQFTAAYADGNLTVTALENTATESISGNITVTSGSLQQVITVVQSGVSAGGGSEVTASVTMSDLGFANAAAVSEVKVDDNVTLTFAQGSASTAPAFYTSGNAVRLYQNGATMNVTAGGKTIKSIEIQFADNHYYIAPNVGEFSAEGATRVWTGEATEILFTTTGTDKDHRAYISAISVTYIQ